MAKAKSTESRKHIKKSTIKRPGVHSKKRNSNMKHAKHYNKLNRGQGR